MNGYVLRPGIVLLQIQGVYLLTADRAARKHCIYMREINEIGAFIWERLEKSSCYDNEEGISVEKIAVDLRQEYDIPAGYDIKADIEAFLQSLKENNYLISVSDSTEEAR